MDMALGLGLAGVLILLLESRKGDGDSKGQNLTLEQVEMLRRMK